MSEHRELSRLPEDPAYWTDLEARVLAGLGTRGPEAEIESWLAPLADRALAIGALALVAAVVALLIPGETSRSLPDEWVRLPEGDATSIAPLSADAPPSLGRLLIP